MIAASTLPSHRCSCTAWIEFLMNSDWSRATSMPYPFGSCGFRSSMAVFTLSTTSTVLVPLCLRMLSSTAARCPWKPADSGSALPSSTSATSRSRTA
jgi:hypothetical protein